jgi:hypothetical protein
VKGATIFEEACKPDNACYHFEMKGEVVYLSTLMAKAQIQMKLEVHVHWKVYNLGLLL